MAAVAVKGFEELAERLRTSKANAAGETDILRNVCAAYLEFAHTRRLSTR